MPVTSCNYALPSDPSSDCSPLTPKMSSKIAAIIAAAGQGRRMGASQNKVLLSLHDCNILELTLRRFLSHPQIGYIYLVFAPEDQASMAAFAALPDVRLVLGGARRQDSVAAALKEIQQQSQLEQILVHDAARPLCSTDLISRVIQALETHPAVIPVIPLKDTLRQLQGQTATLVDRKEFVATQTPQGFHLQPYTQATEQSLREQWEVTDDGSLLERFGLDLHLIPGEETNIKITTPLDLQFARFLLAQTSNPSSLALP